MLLFSGRDDDISILKHFLAHSSALPESLNIRIVAFQSIGQDPSKAQPALEAVSREFPDAALTIVQRRVQHSDLETIEDLVGRDIFLCGPDVFMSWCESALSTLGINQVKIHREQFAF